MGSTSTSSFIPDIILILSRDLDKYFCIKKFFGYLNKIQHLYIFLNFVIGASTGPKKTTSLIVGSFDLIFSANFITRDSFLPDIINDINR